MFVVRALAIALAFSLLMVAGPQNVGRAAEKTTITFWTFLPLGGTRPREMAETQIIQNFEKAHPDIDVKVQVVPWNELHSQYLAAFAAGRAPDVVRVDPTQLLLLVKANSLAPLDPYVKNWSASERDDFFNWNGSVFNGKKWSMPLDENVFTLVYRKDLFAEKKLSPPKSWQDFVNDAKALTTADRWGFAFPAAKTGSYFHVIYAPLVWGAGGEVVDSQGRAAFNNGGGVKALQFLNDLVHVYKVSPPDVLSLNLEDVMQGFMAGKYAMVIEGAIRYSTLQTSAAVKDKIGVAFIPSMNGRSPAPAYRTGGWNIGLNANSQHKDAAWQFINYYVSREAQATEAKVGGDFPARKSVFQDPFMKTPEKQYLGDFYNVLVKASKGPILTDRWSELFDNDLMVAVQSALGGQNPKVALDDAVSRFNH